MSSQYLYGLDISLKNTGLAVYDLTENKFVFIGSHSTESIKATKEYKNHNLHALKLNSITDWFKGIHKEYPPTDVAIERMFSRFPTETQVIAKATGVMQVLIWNTPQTLYPPKSVKLAIWHGSASKEDIKNEILKRYPDLEMANEDESDAVAVVLCHLIAQGLIDWEKSPLPEKEKKVAKKKVKKDKVEVKEEKEV